MVRGPAWSASTHVLPHDIVFEVVDGDLLLGDDGLDDVADGNDTDELPFLASWGGWLSLAAFAVIAYSLIKLPVKKSG